MCAVSMIHEHYQDKWNNPNEWWKYTQTTNPQPQITILPQVPSAEEINEFHKLLERAREYDKKFSQPDCELEAKKDVLRQMAKAWKIDLSFIDKDEK